IALANQLFPGEDLVLSSFPFLTAVVSTVAALVFSATLALFAASEFSTATPAFSSTAEVWQ
ncbi:MAG TPA: hypothetical protein VIT00_06975, partial [Terrimicrobiaceae bacterium]